MMLDLPVKIKDTFCVGRSAPIFISKFGALMDDAAEAYQKSAPIKSQEIATNTGLVKQATEKQHSMARAKAYLNKTLERGEHSPVPGIDAG